MDALERMAVSYPCTSDRTLVWVDAVMGVASLGNLFAYEQTPSSQYGYTLTDEVEVGLAKISYGVMGLAAGVGAIVGLNKTNDCRAFNARLLELRRSDAVGQASHEWLDELSPPPDLGVAAFDPVFGLPIK
ncbi:MAG: hypothetical protein VYA70_03380, partial [Gemmatimonadota bacterium]|nr:hypothetical protein [Gemmatimonadota bacterium]